MAATPSYGIIDSQSTKIQYASEERGIDGGKLVKGRKCHIVVDPLGNVLPVQVHAANVPNPKAGCAVLQRIVERIFAWLGGFRRLAKDFEILTATAENMIRIAMFKITLDKCV